MPMPKRIPGQGADQDIDLDDDLDLEQDNNADDQADDDLDDAGDDEPGDEDLDVDASADDDEPEPEPQPRGRRDRRVAAALAERDRLRRENEELRRAAQPQQSFQPQQRETPQQREARLAALPPEQRILTELNEMRAEQAYHQQLTTFRANDYADKAAFDALAASDPRARRYAQEVERQLAQLRLQGQNVDRKTLLKYIVGEAVFANPARKSTKNNRQRQGANERVERERVNPPRNPRGDRGSARGEPERAARAKRLRNMQI